MGEGAEVTWLIVQEQPETATHLAQFKAHLGKNSKLTVFFMNAGGKLVRQENVVAQLGAQCAAPATTTAVPTGTPTGTPTATPTGTPPTPTDTCGPAATWR